MSTPAAKPEASGATSTPGIAKPTLRQRFDGFLPQHRTYLGLSRRWFLIAVLCAVLAVLALIIGLAVGLTRDSGSGR